TLIVSRSKGGAGFRKADNDLAACALRRTVGERPLLGLCGAVVVVGKPVGAVVYSISDRPEVRRTRALVHALLPQFLLIGGPRVEATIDAMIYGVGPSGCNLHRQTQSDDQGHTGNRLKLHSNASALENEADARYMRAGFRPSFRYPVNRPA